MAVLSNQDRLDAAAEFMRDIAIGTLGAVTKADLRAAINGLDDYIHTNAAAINTAIPQPARGQLTQAQKALLLNYVVTKRYIRGA